MVEYLTHEQAQEKYAKFVRKYEIARKAMTGKVMRYDFPAPSFEKWLNPYDGTLRVIIEKDQ